MFSRSNKLKKIHKKPLDNFKESSSCMVSKASTEIMLDRFCNGKDIDFPFLEN